jgi:hypothetical protein
MIDRSDKVSSQMLSLIFNKSKIFSRSLGNSNGVYSKRGCIVGVLLAWNAHRYYGAAQTLDMHDLSRYVMKN